MLINDFVEISVRWRSKPFYGRLGYNVTDNERIKIRTSHLSPSSNIQIRYKCDSCERVCLEPYNYIFKNRVGRSSGTKDFCRFCLGRYLHRKETKINNFNKEKYENALRKIRKSVGKFDNGESQGLSAGYYVYRFLDRQGYIVYVGRTKQRLRSRMNQHFGPLGHLPEECYKSVDKIQYIKLRNESEMLLYEIYLINKFTPKFNVEYNKGDDFLFELPELQWQPYELNASGRRSTDDPNDRGNGQVGEVSA